MRRSFSNFCASIGAGWKEGHTTYQKLRGGDNNSQHRSFRSYCSDMAHSQFSRLESVARRYQPKVPWSCTSQALRQASNPSSSKSDWKARSLPADLETMEQCRQTVTAIDDGIKKAKSTLAELRKQQASASSSRWPVSDLRGFFVIS